MSKVFSLLTILGLLVLAACGSAAATATSPPPPTATPAPPTATTAPPTATTAPPTATTAPPTATTAPPTATSVPPTATKAATATTAPTVAPTAAATRAATAGTSAGAVTDSSGKCQMVVDPAFKAGSGSKDTFTSSDNLVVITFAGADTPGLAIGPAGDAFIEGFKSVVTGYAETGRSTDKDARGDIELVRFTGTVGGKDVKGIFYFVQNNSILCSLVALAVPPGDATYSDQAQATAETLQVKSGAAVSPPAPTATKPPASTAPSTAPSAAPSAAPTRAAASAPPAAGGATVKDSQGYCQMTLPATFKADPSTADSFQTADKLAIVNISGSDNGPLAFDEAVNIYLDSFKILIDGYTETGRQANQGSNGQELTITYTGTLIGQPIKGVLYFVQIKTTFCSLSGIAIPPGDTKYVNDLQTMIDSLVPIK